MIEIIEKREDGIDTLLMRGDSVDVTITNWGCTILSIMMEDKNGSIEDVVLGYDTIEEYQSNDGYLGALVGRVANRIEGGHFVLNGKEYSLAINNGPNHLHGGIQGFSYQTFDYEIIDESSIRFHYVSKDQEEGYPGNLDFYATYTLQEDVLTIDYKATSDKDTLINITNHSYFNLSGHKESIHNHKIIVRADTYACVDNDGLTTGEIKEVTNTPFDLRKETYLGDMLVKKDKQLTISHGYDHPFIFTKKEDQVMLRHEKSGRVLIVSTTLPQAQLYSANYLEERIGRNEEIYHNQDALCIETQNMPDAIHLEDHPTTILKKGEIYHEVTSYKFKVEK